MAAESAPGPRCLSLNKDQHAAVHFSSDVPLQILAGPGSGKTRVLTARVAYLVQEKGVSPSQICAVTFTNKAAREMKARLTQLIGLQHTNALMMGTFHALCARFLRKYGSCISLPNNFTICDADESKKMIAKILKEYAEELSVRSLQLKGEAVLVTISKAKAKGLSPDELRRARTPTDVGQEIIARIYEDYTAALKESNSLDFDDLLMFGVKLFTKDPSTAMWCRHVLVDEFQDTNSMQYELMALLASCQGSVTIVGDPDQSIYGWRSADVTNLGRMRKDFPLTQQIFLEENYRSTGPIIAASLAIVSQDKSRIAKSLRTSHEAGILPTLQLFATERAEGEFIAREIKRLVAHSGGMLGWNDFVVLLRFNALSRVTEAALQKEGIPSRILGGQKFFERIEIKDILAYLQIIDNPSYAPAFNRAAHTPPRGIGEKSISELVSRAKALKLSPMELAEQIHFGQTPDIKSAVKRKLESLVKPVVALRKLANEGASVSDLIRRLLLLIDYEAHLKKSQQDWETRWDNVQELVNFASQSENDDPSLTKPVYDAEHQSSIHIRGPEQDVVDPGSDNGDPEPSLSSINETPLRMFLQATMLFTDVETHDGDSRANEMVTISTCHSAKGLEWPVVFVPAVEQGIFPFYRAEDVEEERRLLYVACTRAQGLLYLSHTSRSMAGGEWVTRDLSGFVSKLPRTLFSSMPPSLTAKDRREIAKLIGRDPINEEIVQGKIQEYNATTKKIVQSPSSTYCTDRGPDSRPDPGFDVTIRWASYGTQPPQSASQNFMRPRVPVQGTSTNPTLGPSPCLTSAFSSQIGTGSRGITSKVFLPNAKPLVCLSTLQSSSNSSKTPCLQEGSVKHSDARQFLSYGTNIKLGAGKKRLGMGRPATNGYSSKKSKSS